MCREEQVLAQGHKQGHLKLELPHSSTGLLNHRRGLGADQVWKDLFFRGPVPRSVWSGPRDLRKLLPPSPVGVTPNHPFHFLLSPKSSTAFHP